MPTRARPVPQRRTAFAATPLGSAADRDCLSRRLRRRSRARTHADRAGSPPPSPLHELTSSQLTYRGHPCTPRLPCDLRHLDCRRSNPPHGSQVWEPFSVDRGGLPWTRVDRTDHLTSLPTFLGAPIAECRVVPGGGWPTLRRCVEDACVHGRGRVASVVLKSRRHSSNAGYSCHRRGLAREGVVAV